MKQYNRTTKKWEEVEKNGSLKKPKLCKGQRPHDFVLLIPPYINHKMNLSKDEIESYYEIENNRNYMNKEFDKELLVLGVVSHHWSTSPTRFYRCSVCGKQKYDYKK
jgi:hypothetical protein